MDYVAIKTLAKQTGCKVTDLIALAPQNDPFYVGTPSDIRDAEWFEGIWKAAGYSYGVHLRRVHYWTISSNPPILMPNGKPYENTDDCWCYLCVASKKARYLGLVRIEQIIDNKHPKPHIHANYNGYDTATGYTIDIPDLNDPEILIHGLENISVQPYHLEIWCEKSTMNDVLIPACADYNANLATFEGEVSLMACHQLVQRIEASGGKPARIWYISDFDPAGNSMPVAMARKVEFMLADYDCDVRIKPLVLTHQQVKRYQLPRIPIKASERRAARFEEVFGIGAVELDALEAIHPGVLAELVRGELEVYYSHEAEDEVEEQRQSLQQAVSKQIETITSRYKRQIMALQNMRGELDEIEVDTSEYNVDRYDADAEENDDEWLFDSQRDYGSQIEKYKAHKNGNAITE